MTQSSTPDATSLTEELIHEAAQRISMIPLPAIIMGDFNMPVDDSQAIRPLLQMGYLSLETSHRRLYGEDMPRTCREATAPDNAVIHPQLEQLLTSIHITKDAVFDSHDVVLFDLDLPSTPLGMWRLQIPATWTTLPLTDEEVKKKAEDNPPQPGISTIHEWCQHIEHIVDQVVMDKHAQAPETNAMTKLAKHYKGRGKPRKATFHPFHSQVKKSTSRGL